MTNYLKRDTSSKALLNTDIGELKKYRAEKAREKRIVALEEKVEFLLQSLEEAHRMIQRMAQNDG